MGKKLLMYQRMYVAQKAGTKEVPLTFPNREDTIFQDLEKMCVYQGRILSKGDNERHSFLWQEPNSLVSISLTPEPTREQLHYVSFLEIQVMPESANLPDALKRLIESKGYKEYKEPES
jgi:hypothetical protein